MSEEKPIKLSHNISGVSQYRTNLDKNKSIKNTEPREFKVGDVISMDEVDILKVQIGIKLFHNSKKKLDVYKLRDIVFKSIKLKIVALPEVCE